MTTDGSEQEEKPNRARRRAPHRNRRPDEVHTACIAVLIACTRGPTPLTHWRIEQPWTSAHTARRSRKILPSRTDRRLDAKELRRRRSRRHTPWLLFPLGGWPTPVALFRMRTPPDQARLTV